MSPTSKNITPSCIEMIERLVSFDTTSHKENIQLIHFAADFLQGLGAETRLTWDDSRRKANLFATIGPSGLPGIVLSGHTDVVPVDGQDWEGDPFDVVRRDDRLFGRGTADMKSFIAICLALAPEFAARPLALPIHFAFSYDEEVGCIGVRRLISDLGSLSVRPKLCIVGEPTEMQVIIGHKGKKNVLCHVHGKECHSALNDRGVNAVEIAADMVAFMRSLQKRIREHGPFDHGYDPPYSTVHTGTIHGGTALNIVPASCSFEFEIRNLPNHDSEALMAEIRGHAQDLVPEMLMIDGATGIMFDEYNTTAGLDTGEDDEAALLARHLSGANGPAGRVSFTTEAGLFHAAGIPAVVCGPGSIAQAHKPNEFIELSQVAQGEAFIRRLLDHMTRT
ncbi:putative Acetylornithine deacetylase (ArgE) [Magnetospirillum sp. LM-5]|uniref:acetylornithine deacetylase n=1 Tax=Magnetospirillum sp. LM-5 TaxID=2681466 RepID=UPI00137FC9C0|nr:acetylornithine deacetylase [Magnetospirillum sp. LM-5]CAA7614004.1 putative Acetylornithine deacetylase (ArgE) [Magnetospirillum sp. LM-5]